MLAMVGAAAQINPTWKAIAVLIGLAVLGLLWACIGLTNKKIGWKIWKLVKGADGPSSTSKFQWAVWLVVILFAYTVLWVLRARAGDYSAITTVPANLLIVLGFSTTTAAAAKGITVGYVQSGRITKPAAAQGDAGGILQDDTGYPDLTKIQMIGFTFIAVGVFLATFIHEIHTNSFATGLPNIDSSLLVLMGLSQGGYVGQKLVSSATRRAGSPITPPGTAAAPAADAGTPTAPPEPAPQE
jgi:hypothetical protein